jgi:hypothetical protein
MQENQFKTYTWLEHKETVRAFCIYKFLSPHYLWNSVKVLVNNWTISNEFNRQWIKELNVHIFQYPKQVCGREKRKDICTHSTLVRFFSPKLKPRAFHLVVLLESLLATTHFGGNCGASRVVWDVFGVIKLLLCITTTRRPLLITIKQILTPASRLICITKMVIDILGLFVVRSAPNDAQSHSRASRLRAAQRKFRRSSRAP